MRYRIERTLDPETLSRIDQLFDSAPNAHFTQHPAWALVPGEDPRSRWAFFLGEEDARIRVSAMVRLRQTPVLGYCLADVFRGPVAESPSILLEGVRGLQELLAPMRPLAIRIDPYWSGPGSEQVGEGLARLGYTAIADPLWSARSLEVEIDRDPEDLILAFTSDARYNVRKAQRLQVQVREDLDDGLLGMLDAMYRQMAAAKEGNPRPAGFFRGIGQFCREWPRRGLILSSWVDREMLSWIVVFTLGRRAIYAYGASSTGKPSVPKSHLLHFIAMQRARSRGCAVYDMGGFGAGAGQEGGQTRVQRINYFKSGFGGREIDFLPAHERILRPVSYDVIKSLNRLWARARAGRAA